MVQVTERIRFLPSVDPTISQMLDHTSDTKIHATPVATDGLSSYLPLRMQN